MSGTDIEWREYHCDSKAVSLAKSRELCFIEYNWNWRMLWALRPNVFCYVFQSYSNATNIHPNLFIPIYGCIGLDNQHCRVKMVRNLYFHPIEWMWQMLYNLRLWFPQWMAGEILTTLKEIALYEWWVCSIGANRSFLLRSLSFFFYSKASMENVARSNSVNSHATICVWKACNKIPVLFAWQRWRRCRFGRNMKQWKKQIPSQFI